MNSESHLFFPSHDHLRNDDFLNPSNKKFIIAYFVGLDKANRLEINKRQLVKYVKVKKNSKKLMFNIIGPFLAVSNWLLRPSRAG